MFPFQILTLSAVALLLAGCPTPATKIEPTFNAIQKAIFNPSCSSQSCHGSPSFKGGLSLQQGEAYQALVGVLASNDVAKGRGMKRVDPTNPDGSFLVSKLTGPGPEEGDRMPQRNAALDAEAISAIREWIRQGAKP